jgi:enoyl-CoA hydratase/carnithine racemase
MPRLRCEIEQGLATIVLNNPPQNRLTPQMVDELCEIVNVVGQSEARAVLLYAEGPDFNFGGDIVPWPAMSPRELRTLFERYLSAFNQFEQVPANGDGTIRRGRSRRRGQRIN